MESIIQQISENLFIKREDLLPVAFGGNKYRIAREFLDDMRKQGKDCMIGYGSSGSNLNRTLAVLCRGGGVPCYLISPSNEEGERVVSFNKNLCDYSEAKFIYCSKNNVAETVQKVQEECVQQGFQPYYINGDRFGKGNEKTALRAYIQVYLEICKQGEFDYIFLPCGTGMTQSGLLAGKYIYGGKEKIIGISIARNAEKEKDIIRNYLNCYFEKDFSDVEDINVTDDYLCGGYGKYTDKVEATIETVYSEFGIPLDPVYTGKAFYGMTNYLKKHSLQDKKVLFIHTGGTPLFFDYLSKKKEEFSVKRSGDIDKVEEFLFAINDCLPTPLTERVNIRSYAEKVLKYGNVLAVEKKGKIVASSLFYANDVKTHTAYLTMLGVLPKYEWRGLAKELLKQTESFVRKQGMRRIKLETETDNTRAVALYSGMGFKVENLDGKLHMTKEIAE